MTAHTGPMDPWPDPMMQLASDLGLSKGTANVLRLLYWLPLASAGDIAGILSRSASSVLKAIRGLRRARLLEPAQLGCTMGQRQRWYLSYECLERAGLSGVTWHDEAARCRLIDLLPALEQVYQAIGSVRTMGNFCEFQWLDALGIDGPSCDAVCRFQRGWVALFRCGSLLSERTLTERLLRLPLDCQALAVGSPRPWPDILLLVVADEWEREVAGRVLEDLGLEGQASIHCMADGSVTGPAQPGDGKGWVYQPLRKRSGEASWENAVEDSLWAGAGGLQSWKVLEAMVQWPGSHLRFLKAVLKEKEDENRVRGACRRLAASGLVLQAGEGRDARYFAATRGLGLRAGQDRVRPADARTRTGLSQWQEASPRPLGHTVSDAHEDGLREDLLGHFIARGCPVANGPRHTEHLGAHGGIAPDAMVHLTESPCGPGWHYVEYERSARGRSRVEEKLRGYGSPRRRDRYPVVLVCRDDEAEAHFQDLGRELGLALVTTTLGRLRKLGPGGCWSMYGEPVRLG